MVDVKNIAEFLADNFELLKEGDYWGFEDNASVTLRSEEIGNLNYYLLKNGIDMSEKLGKVPRACFTSTRIKAYNIPANVTSIEEYAFEACSWLTSVTIPKSVVHIGDRAFADCASLENVTIPGSVTSMGFSAFSGCFNLKSVTIQEGVTQIGDYAFHACSSLESIAIPGSIKIIRQQQGSFSNCSNLRTIKYNGTIENWRSILHRLAWPGVPNDCQVICTDGTIKLWG